MLIDEQHATYNQPKVVLNVNFAPNLNLSSYTHPFGFQLVSQPSMNHYIYQRSYVTALLVQSYCLKKVLITNLHPDYQLLGSNFIKSTQFLEPLTSNIAVVVNSHTDLLFNLRMILSNFPDKMVYIYF